MLAGVPIHELSRCFGSNRPTRRRRLGWKASACRPSHGRLTGIKRVRRKVFQDFANTLPAMLVGWRMQQDLEVLSSLPNGRLTIDVLQGTASHSSGEPVSLWIAGELQAWLTSRMEQVQTPLESLDSATIAADITTDRISTNRKRIVSFDFNCQSSLTSGSDTYLGSLVERHIWHNRVSP